MEPSEPSVATRGTCSRIKSASLQKSYARAVESTRVVHIHDYMEKGIVEEVGSPDSDVHKGGDDVGICHLLVH